MSHPGYNAYSLTSHFPKKHLGQNFLIDGNIRERIVAACKLNETDTVLEIGPGKGALTELIAQRVQKVIAVETDTTLINGLKEKMSVYPIEIIHQDILEFDLDQLPAETKIIGNLPYNISTPIIEKILTHPKKFKTFFLTIQWELGVRLCAQPGSKDYSSFSCFVQYYADPKVLFKIKNTAFKPTPKVQSCFLELTILPQPRYLAKNEKLLFTLTQTAFQQRRKTIQNSLNQIIDKTILNSILEKLNIDLLSRAENLSLKNFVDLSNELSEQKING